MLFFFIFVSLYISFFYCFFSDLGYQLTHSHVIYCVTYIVVHYFQIINYHHHYYKNVFLPCKTNPYLEEIKSLDFVLLLLPLLHHICKRFIVHAITGVSIKIFIIHLSLLCYALFICVFCFPFFLPSFYFT